MECCCITTGAIIVIFLILLASYLRKRINAVNFAGWHIIVTGGSCGIGKAIAIDVIRRGAKRVTIIARRQDVLETARNEILSHARNADQQTVDVLPIDVSDAKECEVKLGELLERATKSHESFGGLALFCSAGFSIPKRFLELEPDEVERLMRVNYFGSVNTVRGVLRRFVATEGHNGGEGASSVGPAYANRLRVCLVSSICGQLGLFAFTAYCATKFALRGFAESLQFELIELAEISRRRGGVPLDARITVAHPPDTDTPGFAEENRSKPAICRKLSEGAALCSAAQVAHCIVKDTSSGTFLSSVGLEGHLVTFATSGFSPCFTLFDAIVHAAAASLCRVVALFVLHFSMFPIVRKLAGQPDAAESKKTL